MGKLVAHSLRGIPDPPPVTLLLHKKTLLEEWENGPKEIRLTTDGIAEARTGFDVELALPRGQRGQEDNDQVPSSIQGAAADAPPPPVAEDPDAQEAPTSPIHNLIVTVKAPNTVSALSAIQHRLIPQSTILFLQNGMGILDEVNTHIFPSTATRPTYMLGIISHGINSQSTFSATHAGHGTISLGILPRPSQAPPNRSPSASDSPASAPPPSPTFLLQTLERTPVLSAFRVPYPELLSLQLEKLAVNAVLNPLTALLRCRNGAALSSPSVRRTSRLLLAEIGAVVRALPELAHDPSTPTRFGAERLGELVRGVAERTAQNVSSMLADVRAGRGTEIEFINGFVVRKGREVGVECPVNEVMVRLVEGRGELGALGLVEEGRGDVPYVKAVEKE